MNSRAVEFLTFPLPASRATPLQSRTSALPPSFALLITDTLESPGLFLLCHFITKALRKEISAAAAVTMREDVKGKGRVVMVGVSKEEGFYDKILKKSGIQLSIETSKRNYQYLSAQEVIESPSSQERLQKLWDDILLQVNERDEDGLVLIDDVTALLWSGIEPRVLFRWLSSLRTQLLSRKHSLVLLMHGDDLPSCARSNVGEDNYIFRRLQQISDLWLETTSLSSQSRGELSIHRGPILSAEYEIGNRSGPTALHYKLEEGGAVFSIKGLGEGFL